MRKKRRRTRKGKVDRYIYVGKKNDANEKETHACMKARSRLIIIIDSSMPLVELG